MSQAIVTEKHERLIRRVFDRQELEALLFDQTVSGAGIAVVASACKVEVRFEDETAGSPAYKVGTRAVVAITEDVEAAKAYATSSQARP